MSAEESCTVAGCVRLPHSDDPDVHEGDPLVGEGWKLTPIYWTGDADHAREWTVDVETGSYELSLEAAADLASGLMAVAQQFEFADVNFVDGPAGTLHRLRLKTGMSVSDASAATDFSVALIEAVESGSTKLTPPIGHALSLCYAERIAGIEPKAAAPDSPGEESAQGQPVERERVLRPCKIPGCITTEHDWVDGVMDDECCCMTVGSGAPCNERWFVAGYRDAESGSWEAFTNADMDELHGVEGLVEIERFAVAYRAVQAHCEALNQEALTAFQKRDDLHRLVTGRP